MQSPQIDKQLASGEYFLNEAQRKLKKAAEKRERAADKAAETADAREDAFVAPVVRVTGAALIPVGRHTVSHPCTPP